VLAETSVPDERSLFVFQVGLAALWRAWGVEPHAVVGEGAGEIAAAHVAGGLLLDDAARLACARAALTLAAQERGVPTRAAAEAAMSQARLSGALAEVTIPIYSTVTGQIVAADKLDAAYWARNAIEAAQVGPTVEHLASEGYDVFVELAREPVIGPQIERTLANAGESGGVVQTLRADRSERDAILDALAHLETLGCRVDWSRQYPRGLRPTDLPTYAWQRERFWSEDAPEPRAAKQNGSSTAARGNHHEAAATGGE
jgi:acyl transferase domain-containing protein